MQATMMNFYQLPCHQSMVVSSPSDPVNSFSPSTTPSPPAINYHSPEILRRSYLPLPLQYHPHQPIKSYNQQEFKVSRPKRAFTIEAILGLDQERDFVGAVRYGRERIRSSPYVAAPASTPRAALTSLLPSSPESSPKKDDSKCRSHHLSSTTDDSDLESKYGILHQGSNSTSKSPGHKSPPHTSGKMKRIRTIFTPEQLERLESEFERQQYMVGPERLYLASTLNLSESQVKIWFQNRRIKWRKQHVEMQQATLAQIKESDRSHRDSRESDVAESESDADQCNQQNMSPSSWDVYSADGN